VIDPPALHAPLRNRLKKNLRKLEPWAKRERITCFRVYDRDLPEVPLALDLYRSTTGERWLHASVFEPKHGIEGARVDAWTAAAALELGIEPDRTVLKRRSPGARYEKQTDTGERFQVDEAGCRFWVNLKDYVDTGLFLDHRQTRAMVRKESEGKRVLNLFAYTGAFSVQAAAGGAQSTVSVDLSPTYAAWTAENLALNGFTENSGPHGHFVVVMDVMEWLAESRETFDLAVIDPPTMSKSKRAAAFEVQRDHERLIAAVIDRLTTGGVAYFSTNFQGFVLGHVKTAVVDDITAKTVPLDFPRRPPIHRAWRFEK